MRFGRFVTAGAVATTALLVGLGPTAANAAPAANANAPLDTSSCGTGSAPNVGFVNFHKVGNTVSLNVHLKDAQPNTTYQVALNERIPGGCAGAGGASITTNSNGVGNGVVRFVGFSGAQAIAEVFNSNTFSPTFTPVVSLS
jgi:hypothetical protein